VRPLACLVLAASLIPAAQTLAQVFNTAVAALNNGNYTAAEEGFQEVLKAAPVHIGALQNLGLVYSRTDRLDQAIAIYRRALELSPANKSVLLNLLLVFMKRESYGEAATVFQSLIKADPGSSIARDTGLLSQLAAGYLKQHQSEEVQPALSAMLNGVPPAPASFVVCRVYSEAGRFAEAGDQCRKTLAIDRTFPGAHRELGKAMVGEHSADAPKELAAAVRQDPNDREAIYYLGVALLQADRFAEASQYLERAMNLNPGFWGTYFYLGKAKLNLKQADETINLFQKAAVLNPRASIVFYELGLALKAAGRSEEAIRAMDRVRELRALELENDVKVLRKQ
jgi:tetratricopeptide (TPR) repeat protein